MAAAKKITFVCFRPTHFLLNVNSYFGVLICIITLSTLTVFSHFLLSCF